jgi:branched-chain amino acid transport system ATP-binding protein
MLRVDELHTYLGASHVLQGVTFSVERGRVAAMLGRNGVGKTTTVRSIIGLARPRAGRIAVGNKAIEGLPPHLVARAGVAYVPEGRMIFPDLTAVENIRIAQRRAPRHWTADELFKLFPALHERRHHLGAQLSGGEQQMLAIARALVSDPSVLLLDEPSQGLAPLVVRELTEVIRRLRDQGVAILLVEQNLALAEAVADDVHVMIKGRVVYHAPLAAFQSDREQVKSMYLSL